MKKKTTYSQFHCPLLEDMVRVGLTYPTEKNRPRVLLAFDCFGKTKCAVAEKSGNATNFNWSKCAHPELKRYGEASA